MKKILFAIITIALSFSLYTTALADDNIKVILNGEYVQFDAEPFIEDGRTLVPIRAITEAMGCNVEWDSSTQTANIANRENSVSIKIGNINIEKTSFTTQKTEILTIDVPAKIYQDRTYIPLRAVSEAFGADIDWDGNLRLITIEYLITTGSDEVITFSDKAFEYSVRDRLGFIEMRDDSSVVDGVYEGVITENILAKIVFLPLQNSPDGTKLKSISDINKLPNLKEISIDDGIENIQDMILLSDNNVNFVDLAFEICVRINIADDYTTSSHGKIYIGDITDDMLSKVTSVSANVLPSFLKIESLDDLKLLPNIKQLILSAQNSDITDYSPIAFIKEWDNLDLNCLNIEDDSFLNKITVTKELNFPNLGDVSYIFFLEDDNITYKQALSMYRQTIEGLNDLKSQIKTSMSDYEKFKKIHDYVILNMEYDWDRYEATVYGYDYDDKEYTVPSELTQLFVVGKGVCANYSEIYSKLCAYFGLNCWYVYGDADGAYGWGSGHAWNIVELDGNYYHVDVTFDDWDEGGDLCHDYFLVSDDTLKVDHVWGYDYSEDASDDCMYRSTFDGYEYIDGIPKCLDDYSR